jgi:UDP-glucose 4-epimerase
LEVLVTGSAGFIGRHTVAALKEKGHSVRTFDMATGGDLRDGAAVHAKIKGADAVIHLGALAEVPYSFEHPAQVSDVNITGTINVLEACRKNNVRKFVFASSSSVYGEPEKLPVTEDHPLRPTTPYGMSKLVGEQFSDFYHQLYGLQTVNLRYFNIYGVGQSRGIVGDSLNAIRNGKPVVIFGDGKQTRDFINVADVAEINSLALADSVLSGPYNVGAGVETSIGEIVKTLQALTGTSSTDYRPERVGDIRRIYADTSKITKVIKYRPRISLKEGLAEVVRSR